MMDTKSSDTPVIFGHVPHELTRRKDTQMLCRTDRMVAAVQTVGEGGETNLHSHPSLDGFWFVLRGQARFYTTGDELLADIGPFEGILIPRGFPYWFESSSDENLEILQVEASTREMRTKKDLIEDRIDYAPRHEDFATRLSEIENS
jgi:mannose-6-phosphate isomerase-like protein (cupin superfamily)